MELVIEKQAMTSLIECANYTVPEGMRARFKFEGCYPDGTARIAKGGEIKAQLSMHNEVVTVNEAGQYEVCVLGKNTKSSVYVQLLCDEDGQRVIVAPGRNVTVDTTETDTTITYTVHADSGGSHTIVRAGQNTTVVESTEGDKTVYTVSASVPSEKIYKVTSTNTETLTVSENTSGNTTTFSLTATGGGADVSLESTDPNLIIIKE